MNASNTTNIIRKKIKPIAMRKKELTGILGCFVLLFFAVVAWAAPVPDTGQSKCYNNTVEIPCPSPGQPFYGQDANYTINPMSYTKLDGSGNVLSSSATSWVMVKDNVTGLIWENKTDDGTIHDKDNSYTWYDSNPATNGGYAGTPGDGTDTEDFISALNIAHFGGYSDWRLPTIKELITIVNYSISYLGSTIDTGYFPNTAASLYWSSTAFNNIYDTNWVWYVSFDFGYVNNTNKNYAGYVRAVRDGQSGPLGAVVVSNSIGSRNTIKISDMSGALPASGVAISITAWDTNGTVVLESGSVAPLKLQNLGTTIISGSDLAARFPSGAPKMYEFSIGSSNAIVTSLTTSVDGTIKTPTVFTIGGYGGI